VNCVNRQITGVYSENHTKPVNPLVAKHKSHCLLKQAVQVVGVLRSTTFNETFFDLVNI
jgi:hypothetical protein